MWKLVAALLGLAVADLAVYAQDAVDAQANVIMPDGRRNLVVSNHSTKTVTAWAIRYRYRVAQFPEEEGEAFLDSVLILMQKPIAPGAQTASPVGPIAIGQRVAVWGVELRAAVFDDGSAFGDPVWVSRIRDRRVIALEELDAQVSILNGAATKAAAGTITRDSLVEQLRTQLADQRDRETGQERKQVIEWMHLTVMSNLGNNVGRPLGEAIDRTKRALLVGIRPRIARAAGLNPNAH